MNKDGSKNEIGKTQSIPRKSYLVMVAIFTLATLALIGVSKFGRQDSNSHPTVPSETVPVAEDKENINAPGNAKAPASKLVRQSTHPTEVLNPVQRPPDLSRSLIKSLGEIKSASGGITPEKAAEWQRKLLELNGQGIAAIPAFQEFFQSNQDVRFDVGPESALLGEPTLRIALVKVLFDLPGPENVELQQQILRTTNDPDEITLLADQLEMQEPGQFRADIIEAAEGAMVKVKTGELPSRHSDALTGILEKYKNTDPK